MNARQWLIETHAHIPPAAALEQLSVVDAERRLPGLAHSIADLVAHMSFWQEFFCRRCEGIADPMPASAALGWPEVAPGSWTDVNARFITGLDRVVAQADRSEQAIAPPIEFPPLSRYTVHDALVHIAQHNSHHLGEVIVLRQLMARWPPPSGSWTW